jgi:hypothetical protein
MKRKQGNCLQFCDVMIVKSQCMKTDPYTLETTFPAFDSSGVTSILTFGEAVSNVTQFMPLNSIKFISVICSYVQQRIS